MARMGKRAGTYRFWWGNMRERDNFKDGRRWKDNIKMNLKQYNWVALTELIWFGIETGGELLGTR